MEENDEKIINIESDIEFIETVKKYPLLYNRSLGKGLSCAEKKKLIEQIWRKIGKIFDLGEVNASKKWRYLRDRFVREHRKNFFDDNEKQFDKSRWVFYKDMLFLQDYIGTKRKPRSQNQFSKIRKVDVRSNPEFLESLEYEDISQFSHSEEHEQQEEEEEEEEIKLDLDTEEEQYESTKDISMDEEKSEVETKTEKIKPQTKTTMGYSRVPKKFGKRKLQDESSINFEILNEFKCNEEDSKQFDDKVFQTDHNGEEIAENNSSQYTVDTSIAQSNIIDDPDRSFAIYVASEMRRMTKQRKKRLKALIINFVLNDDDDE